MRTRLVCTILISLMLASCAESVHQHQRMGLEGEYSEPQAAMLKAPAVTEPEILPSADILPAEKLALSQGQAVSLSGIVLKAKRLDGMTEIEVLQLPLESHGRPTNDRRQSQGRFLARQTTFLDPAILATRPTVTVYGVMEGVVERPLEPGSDNYAYPIIAIQDLTIWPQELLQPYSGSYVSAIGQANPPYTEPGTGFSLGSLGAFFRSFGQALFTPNRYEYRNYYGYQSYSPNYSSSSSSSSSSNPSPPAPKDIPPQFRKGKQ